MKTLFNLKSMLAIGMMAGGSSLFGQYTITTNAVQTSGNIPKYTGSSTVGSSMVYDNGSSVSIYSSAPYSPYDLLSITKHWPGSTATRMTNTNNTGYVNYIATAQTSGIAMSAYGPLFGGTGIFETNSAVLNGSGTTMNIGTTSSSPLTFWTSNTRRMTVNASGQVLIGPEKQDTNPGNHNTALLQVNGDVVIGSATSANLWITQTNWADFVFEKNYKLMPLEQLEKFYTSNHHLPDVPSLSEIQQNGNNIGQTDAVLLQKIEELTLYIVELKKEIETMKKELH